MTEQSPLLTTEEAAPYVRRTAGWLCKARVYGGGPSWVKMGSRVFYRRETLDQWLVALERGFTEPKRAA